LIEPSSRCLLKAIESFVKLAHIVWMSRVNEALGLLHKDILKKMTMEESIGYVKLYD
jgi:hypothetical protein